MGRKTKDHGGLPQGCITVRTYAEMENWVSDFADGKFSLLLIIGRPGTSKSQTVKRSLSRSDHLYIETHASALGMYQELYRHRDLPTVIDDIDSIYSDRPSVRLLKSLCNTDSVKTLRWLTNAAVIGDEMDQTPREFKTKSPVCLIANRWESVNDNVRAIEDRAVIIHFDPTPIEVHQKVASWFGDQEVYDFLQDHLHLIPQPSMRHYLKGAQLRNAGRADWKDNLLEMCSIDDKARAVVALMVDDNYDGENARAEEFTRRGFGSRDTYFARKKRLGTKICHPQIALPNAEPAPAAPVTEIIVSDATFKDVA